MADPAKLPSQEVIDDGLPGEDETEGPIKELSLDNIETEEPIDETEEPVEESEELEKEQSISSKSRSSRQASSISPLELPEGVQYFPPKTVNSTQSFQPSLDSQSRWSALACPKLRYLKDTLERFGERLSAQSRDNLKKQLYEQELVREVAEFAHLHKCTHPPTPVPPSGRRSPVSKIRHEERVRKFNAELKRQAFDRMAEKIFAKLPRLVLQAKISDLSKEAATTQRMINVIFSTICSYNGKPLTIHDHELYQHLSVGLARFIEDIIVTVQRKIYSNESITPKEELHRRPHNRGRCSVTTALMDDLSEFDILRSSDVFKSKSSNICEADVKMETCE